MKKPVSKLVSVFPCSACCQLIPAKRKFVYCLKIHSGNLRMRNKNFLTFKYISGFLLICLLLMAGTCKKKSAKETMAITKALVGKTWLHSHEDDRGDTIVYRPNTYDFPPSRGRTGFMLEADGSVHQYNIAPTDGLEEKTGKWTLRDGNFMDITFPNKSSTDYEIEIISAEPNLLKVKRKYK